MKILKTIFLFSFLVLIQISYGQSKNPSSGDLDLIYSKCRQLLLSDTTYATERSLLLTDDVKHKNNAEEYFHSMIANGSWKDIDYQSKERSAWQPAWHLYRLMLIYREYNKSKKPEMLNAIHNGLQFWIRNDFICDNWWHNQINVPYAFSNLIIMLDKNANQSELDYLNNVLANRIKQQNPTGQNKIWQHDIEARISLIRKDSVMLRKIVDDMQSIISISANEGIQPDFSFHQHGPMLQFGNYGLHFVNSLLYWITITSNSDFAFSQEKQQVLFKYCSDGLRWTLFKGAMDLCAIGRQIRPGCEVKRWDNLFDNFSLILSSQPDNIFFQNLNSKSITGNKSFWRSNYMVYLKDSTYMMSVKTHGEFVKNIESINGENLKGVYLNDGVCLIQRSGTEYRDIAPLWNWTMLPGTTCDTTSDPSLRKLFNKSNQSNFVGQISDGESGISAMYYYRDSLKAYKSYFLANDMLIALGAGIESHNSNKNIVTTVNQRYYNSRKLESNYNSANKLNWLWHDSIAYFFPNEQELKTQIQKRSGNWIDIEKAWGNDIVTDSLITFYLSHTNNNSYSYIVKPSISLTETKKLSSKIPVQILSNSQKLQAIQINNTVFAVFYEPARLKIYRNENLEVDKPCLIIYKRLGKKSEIYISDPTREHESITVILKDKTKNVLLPKNEFAGSTLLIN